MESHLSAQVSAKPQYEMMESLQVELGRYDRVIDQLYIQLQPICLEGPGDSVPSIPMEAPYHELHRLIRQFSSQNERLEDLKSRLKP